MRKQKTGIKKEGPAQAGPLFFNLSHNDSKFTDW